jgi:regulator of sirC expression with transglutaminase-like and TPR domain
MNNPARYAMMEGMRNETPARRRFRALIRQSDTALRLDEAALCIAWEDQGADSFDAALRELDALADAIRSRAKRLISPDDRVQLLNDYLFSELGFCGNRTDYGDPRNSYLDQVLIRRTGLPITLSVVYIELGRRLGFPISGVALPGHFLARYTAHDHDIYIDPFDRGRLWSREECEARVLVTYGQAAHALIDQILEPPTKRAILERMLRNLKNAYVERSDFTRALAAVERIILLDPDDIEEVRDRGLLRAHLGQLHLGLDDLEHYAATMPRAADLPSLRLQARAIAGMIAPRN